MPTKTFFESHRLRSGPGSAASHRTRLRCLSSDLAGGPGATPGPRDAWTFTVWAPHARELRVHLLGESVGGVEPFVAGRTLAMDRREDGYNVAEVRGVAHGESGGLGLDAQWNDDFHHALRALVTGERRGYYADFGELDCLARALRDGFVFQGQYNRARDRRQGMPLRGVAPERLVVFDQNHDQVGNRPRGERLAETSCEGDILMVLRRNRLGMAVMSFNFSLETASTRVPDTVGQWTLVVDGADPELGGVGKLADRAVWGDDSIEVGPLGFSVYGQVTAEVA